MKSLGRAVCAALVSLIFLMPSALASGSGVTITISTQPTDVYKNVYNSKAAFTVTAEIVGGDSSSTLCYQWQTKAADEGAEKFLDISGATSATYTLPSKDVTRSNNGRQYRCRVYTESGTEVCSAAAALYVADMTQTTTELVSPDSETYLTIIATKEVPDIRDVTVSNDSGQTWTLVSSGTSDDANYYWLMDGQYYKMIGQKPESSLYTDGLLDSFVAQNYSFINTLGTPELVTPTEETSDLTVVRYQHGTKTVSKDENDEAAVRITLKGRTEGDDGRFQIHNDILNSFTFTVTDEGGNAASVVATAYNDEYFYAEYKFTKAGIYTVRAVYSGEDYNTGKYAASDSGNAGFKVYVSWNNKDALILSAENSVDCGDTLPLSVTKIPAGAGSGNPASAVEPNTLAWTVERYAATEETIGGTAYPAGGWIPAAAGQDYALSLAGGQAAFTPFISGTFRLTATEGEGKTAISGTKLIISTKKTYTILSSSGEGGSISPAGNVTVDEGGEQTYTVAAENGWQIADVQVDGVSVGAVNGYTFTDVRADHSISASFQKSGARQGGENGGTGADLPQTGDKSAPVLWLGLLGLAVAGLAGSLAHKGRRGAQPECRAERPQNKPCKTGRFFRSKGEAASFGISG